jgi:anti-sigma factor RsiW
MTIDEVTLRAYVDSELSAAERQSVDAALANSSELRAQLAAMKASCLPYQTAFDTQEMPEVPEALKKQLMAMSAVANVPSMPTVSIQNPQKVQALPRRQWLNFAGAGFALAASFAAGVAVRPAWFSGLGSKPSDEVADWAKAVASYQAMYVRDTVERVSDTEANARRVITEFQSHSQAVLVVPDLSNVGFEFKRVQRLAFNDKPLIQMAYLPQRGKPAALCVMSATSKIDIDASVRRLENLSIVTWTRAQLSYVFAVDIAQDDALKIGQAISTDKFPLLLKA